MKEQHPITPPPELVQQWREAPEFSTLSQCALVTVTTTKLQDIATRAAQWGADQELEACCEWLDGVGDLEQQLRAARRPKPLSLKDQALLQLDVITKDLAMHGLGCDLSQIRRALEQLPDQ